MLGPEGGDKEKDDAKAIQTFLKDEMAMYFAQEGDRILFWDLLEKDGIVLNSGIGSRLLGWAVRDAFAPSPPSVSSGQHSVFP